MTAAWDRTDAARLLLAARQAAMDGAPCDQRWQDEARQWLNHWSEMTKPDAATRWIRSYDRDGDYVESLGGIDWAEAEPHRRGKPHTAQTRAFMHGDYVERCTCGAFGPKPWTLIDKPRRPKPRAPLFRSDPGVTEKPRRWWTRKAKQR